MKNVKISKVAISPIIVLILFVLVDATSANQRLCVEHDTSCAYQLWKNDTISENACHMTYIKWGSEECKSLPFRVNSGSEKHLGDLRLQIHPEHENKRTLFDLTYSSISWTRAQIRFKQKHSDTLADFVGACKIFNIRKNVTVPQNAELHYDCPWAYDYNEGSQTFVLEHEGTFGDVIDYRQFVFKIPRYKKVFGDVPIILHELFLYVETTNLPTIQLRIQPLPPAFRVTKYKIEVWRRLRIKEILDVRFVSTTETVNEEIIFDYNTNNLRGHYYFMVSFISEECPENQCAKTASVEVYIGHKTVTSILYGIIGALLCIPLLFFGIFLWNRHFKDEEYQYADYITEPTIKALIIYTPSTKPHKNTVVALSQLLTNTFNVRVFLDVLDIPNTEHKNPLHWCSESFEEATHIIFVASPETNDYPAIYKTDAATLRITEEELINRHVKKQILTVRFPYASQNIPVLRHFRNFELMKDFYEFITYLTGKRIKMYYREYPMYSELVKAVREAELYKPEKSNLQLTKIEIKLISPSKEELHDEEEEECQKLVESKEEPYTYDIRDLNLSGKEEEALQPNMPVKGASFDIQSLNI